MITHFVVGLPLKHRLPDLVLWVGLMVERFIGTVAFYDRDRHGSNREFLQCLHAIWSEDEVVLAAFEPVSVLHFDMKNLFFTAFPHIDDPRMADLSCLFVDASDQPLHDPWFHVDADFVVPCGIFVP